MDPILDPKELLTLQRVTLFDCRSGPQANAAYAQGHLPFALRADLDSDLAAPALTPERGGRHPLPQVEVFAAQLGRWGVTPATRLVAYDEQNGANAAARFWWMMRALGHQKVQVLDGGMQAAVALGLAPTAELPRVQEAPAYPARGYLLPTADMFEVERAVIRDDRVVLDVRAAPRFRGETEPIDPVAGHIPGAHNIPLTENLDDTGRFKPADVLRAQYQTLLGRQGPDQLIVHCGSGVTACHTLLALERAGLAGAKLYVGSWGEWCRNPHER